MSEIKTSEKRPKRFKNLVRKILRYTLASVPYLMYCHIKICLYMSGKIERKIRKIMLKFNLLENYVK